MATAREVLQLLITADAKQAVREIDNVGKAAARDLGKAQDHTQRLATGLTKGGAAAVGFAAVAGGALFSFAKQSEQAQRANLLLENTLQNMPKLAGENKQAFVDVANALQKKTVVDDEAVISAEALLGTFQVTGAEIRKLTPLVVDYARKFDTDLNSAAIQVGKALDGQVGALKRNGVSIDEVLFKTDRYAAVQKALRQQVGGFAEAEGKTFSGQLAILKNQLGDVAEGLGGGVVQALSSAIGPLTTLSDRFSDLDPKTQSAIGKFATFSTAAVGMVGGVSLAAGQMIKLRDRFTEVAIVGGTSTRSLNSFGKVAAGLGVIGVGVGAVVALSTALDGAKKSAAEVSQELSKLSTKDLASEFKALGVEADGGFAKVAKANIALSGFQDLAENNIGTAIRLRDALRDQGEDTSKLDKIIRGATAAQKQSNRDVTAGSAAVDDNTDALAANADAAKNAASRQQQMGAAFRGIEEAAKNQLDAADASDAFSQSLAELRGETDKTGESTKSAGGATQTATAKAIEAADKQRTLRDAFLGVDDAARSVGDAQRALTDAQTDSADAAEKLVIAQGNLNAVLHGRDPHSKEAGKAAEDLSDAQRELEGANLSVSDAAHELDLVLQDQGSTASEVAHAQLALKEAIDRQEGAVAKVNEAQEDYNGTLHGFGAASKEAKDATKDLNAAQREAEAANFRVRDAQLAVEDSTRKQADAAASLFRAQADIAGQLDSIGGAAGRAAAKLLPYEERLRNSTALAMDMAAAIAATSGAAEGSEEFLRAYVHELLAIVEKNPELRAILTNLINDMSAQLKAIVLAGTTVARKAPPLGLGHRAAGGPVGAGEAYLVGEHGPEALVMGGRSGFVVPNVRSAGSGGATVIQLVVDGKILGQAVVDQSNRAGGLPIRLRNAS